MADYKREEISGGDEDSSPSPHLAGQEVMLLSPQGTCWVATNHLNT